MKAQTVIEKLQALVAENPDAEVFGLLLEHDKDIPIKESALICASLVPEQAKALVGLCKMFG